MLTRVDGRCYFCGESTVRSPFPRINAFQGDSVCRSCGERAGSVLIWPKPFFGCRWLRGWRRTFYIRNGVRPWNPQRPNVHWAVCIYFVVIAACFMAVVFKQAHLEHLICFTKIVPVGNVEDVVVQNKPIKNHIFFSALIGSKIAIFNHVLDIITREHRYSNWTTCGRGPISNSKYGGVKIDPSMDFVYEVRLGGSIYKDGPHPPANIASVSFPNVPEIKRDIYVVRESWRASLSNADDRGGRLYSYHSLGTCGACRIARILLGPLDFNQSPARYLGVNADSICLIYRRDGQFMGVSPAVNDFVKRESSDERQDDSKPSDNNRSVGGSMVCLLLGGLCLVLGATFVKLAFYIGNPPGITGWWGFRLMSLFCWICAVICTWQGVNLTFRFIVARKHLHSHYFSYYNNYMANVLPIDKQIAVISSLCEGSSIRSIERITGVHRDTIMRLGVKIGQGCTALMDIKMRNLECVRLEMDEIWGYVGKKEKHVRPGDDPQLGNVWTFCAIDADTKLVPAFHVAGDRSEAAAAVFVSDVAGRMKNRVQISTDGLSAYVTAIEEAFGKHNVDYGQIIKTYGTEESVEAQRRYSAPKITESQKKAVFGYPDWDLVSTSYIERLNATTRLHMKRLARLTHAFSKKRENFEAAVGLHFAYYNFVRRHNTLRCTPAMAAGVEHSFWSVGDLVEACA